MDFTHPHFAEPRWLWLAFLGPLVLLALQRYSAWARQRQLAQMASPHFVAELTRSFSAMRRWTKDAVLLIAVAGLGLALARPQWGQQESGGQVLGQDTLFVLDCSRSMLATDVAPSRLQRAKLAIRDFVQRQAHGRVGLVAFSGQAFLQCPLTYDFGAFDEALSAVDEKTIPVPGTDIGRALDEGFRAMSKAAGRKLVVLLTDGEDLEKGGIKMAERLAKNRLLVYTIGVGTPAGSEIRVVNEQGRQELLRDKNGEVVRSRLDAATLQAIAKETGGAYFPLGPVGEGLAKVQLSVNTLEFDSGSTPVNKLGVDRFHLPVAISLFLLAIESLVGTRRRGVEPGQTLGSGPSVTSVTS
jgi:Ca-activated chloride channel family protein